MTNNRCPLCNADALDHMITFENGSFFGTCERCGLTHISPFPSDNSLASTYSCFGQTYPNSAIVSAESDFSAFARDRFNFVSIGLNVEIPLKICDIGSGYGLFLNNCRKSKWEIHGIEPSKVPVDFSTKELGIPNIKNCMFQEAKYSPNTFDIICSFHVIEHLRKPVELLNYAGRLLKKEGRLFLATPDLCRLTPNLIQYYFLSHGLHLSLFTPRTIESLLGSCGFQIVRLEAELDRPAETGSMILEAVKGGNHKAFFPKEACYAFDYAERLKEMKKCLQEKFDHWATIGKRIAIYGGGIHTQTLIDILGEKGVSAIKIIVDDDPAKAGSKISSISILPFSKVDFRDIDGIVVSTIASETRILKKLQESRLAKEYYGIYQDIIRKI